MFRCQQTRDEGFLFSCCTAFSGAPAPWCTIGWRGTSPFPIPKIGWPGCWPRVHVQFVRRCLVEHGWESLAYLLGSPAVDVVGARYVPLPGIDVIKYSRSGRRCVVEEQSSSTTWNSTWSFWLV